MPAELRLATPDDYAALGKVMYDSVRHGDSPYSDTQRQAWMPKPRSGTEWNERLTAQKIIIAETSDQILGFMSLTTEGYVDFAYLLLEGRGQGLFRKMFEEIESIAKRQGASILTTHASLMAMPAFKAMGFEVTEGETVHIDDVPLQRFAMTKIVS